MKFSRSFVIIINSFLLTFFLGAIAIIAYFFSGSLTEIILFAQMALFAALSCVIIFYALKHNEISSSYKASSIKKIVILSDSNTSAEEFSLSERTSAVIIKDDSISVSFLEDPNAESFAVLNNIDNYWYIERLSYLHSVGLKRPAEHYVYKLKEGLSYKLNVNDIIYIGKDRLLIQ